MRTELDMLPTGAGCDAEGIVALVPLDAEAAEPPLEVPCEDETTTNGDSPGVFLSMAQTPLNACAGPNERLSWQMPKVGVYITEVQTKLLVQSCTHWMNVTRGTDWRSPRRWFVSHSAWYIVDPLEYVRPAVTPQHTLADLVRLGERPDADMGVREFELCASGMAALDTRDLLGLTLLPVDEEGRLGVLFDRLEAESAADERPFDPMVDELAGEDPAIPVPLCFWVPLRELDPEVLGLLMIRMAPQIPYIMCSGPFEACRTQSPVPWFHATPRQRAFVEQASMQAENVEPLIDGC